MPEAPPILFKDSASREECKIRAHEMCSYFHTRGAIVSPSVPSDLESEGAKYEDFQSGEKLLPILFSDSRDKPWQRNVNLVGECTGRRNHSFPYLSIPLSFVPSIPSDLHLNMRIFNPAEANPVYWQIAEVSLHNRQGIGLYIQLRQITSPRNEGCNRADVYGLPHGRVCLFGLKILIVSTFRWYDRDGEARKCPFSGVSSGKYVRIFAQFAFLFAGKGDGGVRSSAAYFAESIRVLCGKYSSTLRKVLFCFPHGLFCPSACPVPFRLLFSFGVPPDGAVSCVAGFVLLLVAARGRMPSAVEWCGGRGRSVLLAQVLVYDFGFGRPDFGGDFFQ